MYVEVVPLREAPHPSREIAAIVLMRTVMGVPVQVLRPASIRAAEDLPDENVTTIIPVTIVVLVKRVRADVAEVTVANRGRTEAARKGVADRTGTIITVTTTTTIITTIITTRIITMTEISRARWNCVNSI